MTEVVEYVYRAHGAARDLFRCHAPEVLLDGPAGTGKSRAVLERVNQFALEYPGCRVLICRKVRADMSETVLPLLEKEVLTPRHESIYPGKVAAINRHSYSYSNGSVIVVGGLDRVEATFSGQYDVIAVFEATEITEDDLQKLQRCLRNMKIPHPDGPRADGSPRFFQQIICDCNPSYEQHWLNRRANTSLMVRLKSRFMDNPSIQPEYIERLGRLTGVPRARLYEGRWIGAEGLVWANFKPGVNVISGALRKLDSYRKWQIVPDPGCSIKDTVDLTWFFAAVDWGWRNPGVILVFGVDQDRNAYCVHEVYRVQQDIDWWAEQAEELRERYDIGRFVCDPSRPEHIKIFNKRMGRHGGLWLGRDQPIAGGASNAIDAGLSVVRERFGTRGLFFLASTLDREDPILKDERKPLCTLDEIPAYFYAPIKDGQPVKEKPAPDSVDHGCDSLRYAMAFLDNNDWNPDPDEESFPAGSYGRLLGHDEVVFK